MQNPAIFTGSEVRINDPDLDTVNLAVAFRGAGWTDPDCIPLMVMQTILGTWDKNIGAGMLPSWLISLVSGETGHHGS